MAILSVLLLWMLVWRSPPLAKTFFARGGLRQTMWMHGISVLIEPEVGGKYGAGNCHDIVCGGENFKCAAAGSDSNLVAGLGRRPGLVWRSPPLAFFARGGLRQTRRTALPLVVATYVLLLRPSLQFCASYT